MMLQAMTSEMAANEKVMASLSSSNCVAHDTLKTENKTTHTITRYKLIVNYKYYPVM